MARRQAAPQPEKRAGDHETVKAVVEEPAEGVESQHTADDRADESQEVADEMPRHGLCSCESPEARTEPRPLELVPIIDCSASPDHNPLAR